MKKLIFIILFFLVNNLYSQDEKEVEREFILIYKEYCKKIRHNIQSGHFLDTVSLIQLDYLIKLEKDIITHHQINVPKYFSIGDRMFSIYDVHRGTYDEIAIIGNFDKTVSAKDKAKKIFDSLIGSIGHKKIMTNKNFKYFSFKIKYKPNGVLVGVGVFSEMLGNE